MAHPLPFRLSIITDEVSQDPAAAIVLAQRFGYEAVELRSVWDSPVELLPEDKLTGLSAMIKEAGLQVSAVASSFMKEDWLRDDREKFGRLVRCCHALGCNMLRGFSFWKSSLYSDAAFADYLSHYDGLLSQEGLCLALENDPAVNLCHAGELFRFFSRCSFESIGVLWDPGNDIYTLRESARPYPEGYESLRPWIRHVHMKDAVAKEGDTVGVAIGDGALDITGQLRALAADSYTGYVTLEPHFRLESALDEEQLRRPGGSAFSENGYLPSLICMENLQTILEKL